MALPVTLAGVTCLTPDGTVRMSWLLASLTHVRTMVSVTTLLIMKGLSAVVHQAGKGSTATLTLMNVTKTHVETGALAPTHLAAIDVPAALATLASIVRWISMTAHLILA